MDGETNPIRAANLLKVQLGLLRTAAVWPVHIGLMPDMEQEDIQPLDVLTLTKAEYGWSNTQCQVVGVVHLGDRTAVCLMRRYDESIYDPTLTLPGIPRRPIRFAIPAPPAVTGLVSDEIAYTLAGGGVGIRLDVSCDPADRNLTGFEIRLKATSEREAGPWIRITSDVPRVSFPDVEVGETYEIRARHISPRGQTGAFTNGADHTVEGDLIPPGALQSASVASLPEGYEVRAVMPADTDTAWICIYSDTDSAFMPATANLIDQKAAPPNGSVLIQIGGQSPNERRYVRLLAKDSSQNEGPATRAMSVTPTPSGVGNIHTGDGDPPDSLGADDDLYLQTDGRLWYKRGGTWIYSGIDYTLDGGALLIYRTPATEALPDPPPPATSEFTSAADGTAAYNSATTQLWRKTGGVWTLIGTLRGTKVDVTDDFPPNPTPGDLTIDGRGCVWQYIGAGTNTWVFTGECRAATVPPPGTDGCTVHPVETWPPPATLGNEGDGAYTRTGAYGVKTATGWETNPSGDMGVPDNHTLQVIPLPELPIWPPYTGYALRKTIVVLLPSNDAYRWNPAGGNYSLIGNLCQSGGETSSQAAPTGLAWSNIAQNTNGSWRARLSWSAPSGAVKYKVDISPYTTAFTTEQETSNLYYDFTDFVNLTSYQASVSAISADGTESATAGISIRPGVSGVNLPGSATNFRRSVSQTTGDVTLRWTPPVTNNQYITRAVLQILQGSTVAYEHQIESATARSATSYVFRAVAAGTYTGASIVFYSEGGAGPVSSAAGFTIAARTAGTPPVRNLRRLSGPTLDTTTTPNQVRFQIAWDAPLGRSPTNYVVAAPPSIRPTRWTGLTFTMRLPASMNNYRLAVYVWAVYPNGTSREGLLHLTRGTPSSLARPAATGLRVTPSQTVRGEATFTWSNPVTAGNRIIAQYIAIRGSGTTETYQYYEYSSASTRLRTSHTFQNVPEQSWVGLVVLIYANGASPDATVTFSQSAPTITTIPVPSGLSVTRTTTSATVRGPSSLPSGVNGVQWFVAAAATPTTPLSTHPATVASAFPIVATGLTADTSYVFNLRYRAGAAGSYRYGGYRQLSFRLGTAPPPTPIPANPAYLRATVSSTTQGTVTFTGARVATATGYTLVWYTSARGVRDPSGSRTFGSGSGASHSITIAGIALGTYGAQWTPRNAGGPSATPATAQFTVTRVTPTGPTSPPPPETPPPASLSIPNAWASNVRAGNGSTYIEVNWGRSTGAAKYSYSTSPTGLPNSAGETTSRQMRLLNPTSGRSYTVTIRPVDSSGNQGTAISVTITARTPSIIMGSGTNAVRIGFVVLLANPHFRTATARISYSGAASGAQYLWTLRLAAAGSTTLYSGSGTRFSVSFNSPSRGLAFDTMYRFGVRARVGSNTYSETVLVFRTPMSSAQDTSASGASGQASGSGGNGASGQAGDGPSGQAESEAGSQAEPPSPSPVHYSLITFGDPISADFGQEGDTATVYDDASEWTKRHGRWMRISDGGGI